VIEYIYSIPDKRMEMNIMAYKQKKGPELSHELFMANYNCAQSTLAGILSSKNREYGSRMKLAGAFGAGIAQQGLMCGAVTGALMAFGDLIPMEGDIVSWKKEVADVSKAYIKLFQERFGELNCSILASCDMSDAVERKVFHDNGGRDRICVPMVIAGTEMALELIRSRK
jgi:C_GCAxxG_C_C family probable redox protein